MNPLGQRLAACWFFAFCSACAGPHDREIPRVILREGLIDIPVVEGSFLTDNCEEAKGFVFTSDVVCVAYPLDRKEDSEVDWASEYLELLTNSGWVLQFGENQVFSLIKPLNENCYEHMNMIGWVQADAAQSKTYQTTGSLEGITNGIFLFAIGSEPSCETKQQTR